MPDNTGFTMTIKANDGTLVPLYPQTTLDQIVGWNAGLTYGYHSFLLNSKKWDENNQQTVELNGITSNDIPICIKSLSGTQEQMTAQDAAYNLLDPIIGVESLQNAVRFTCTSKPTVNLIVTITWTR